jgi:putative nucleotidyltransferase with HDIG domain
MADLATVTTLVRALEARDAGTAGHSERVAAIACLLAEALSFAEDELEAVAVGALIHDIGKLGVPDRILSKPGALSAAEQVHVRRHPEISTHILGSLDLPPVVRHMVRSHHERYAGGGYPDGLAGDDIPLAARVLAVADALDAMTSDRPYRAGRPLDEALDEVRARRGEQFCPLVVGALETCADAPDGAFRGLFDALPVPAGH